MNFLIKIKSILPKSEFNKVYLIFLGVIVSGIIETFSIAIIMPFIAIVSNPGILKNYPYAINALGKIGITNNKEIIITLSIALLFLMCIKNLYLFVFMRLKSRFLQFNIAKCSIRLLTKYLEADYLYHVQTNTSKLLRNLKDEVSRTFTNVLGPIIDLGSEVLLIIFILGLLLAVEPIATVCGVLVLGIVAGLFYKSVDKKNKYYGEISVKHSGETYKWINQSLGGIKEVRLLGREEYFEKQCATHYNKLAQINVYEYLISQAPKFFLEILIVATVTIIIIVLVLQGSTSSQMLPLLALFGVAALRVMPATNRILGSVIALRFSIPAVNVIYDSIKEIEDKYSSNQDTDNGEEITFSDGIYFNNVSFRYPVAEGNALENITLNIPKNKSIGISGASGAGKSTLLNILLGLLKPTKGHILIDKKDIQKNIRGWQRMIGFVPQEVYLTDDSIKRNIAYGLNDSDINESLVWKALELAQLDTFVKGLPKGLNAFVGERGVRISGGQRQRIGIARALYHNPDVLIFDEATSSVDMATEKEITKSIESLAHKKTIVIVTHRLSTIENCDIIYNLDSGTIELRRGGLVYK